ncbi:MAG TPA: histidine--tRNA ligase [Candidatus Sumerlaeota bacterium]|nr:histidine--tRNA ligase [Candidatus Sumerlaeota bacterium]
MALTAPRGTKDILPEEVGYFQMIEETARRVFARYGYQEIRTPIFEGTELFSRSIGEETDIVSKEMFTFPDRKGRSMTLRPEGTAPVVRALVQHNAFKQQGVQPKVYYLGPMFRYERPQAGRQRQFNTVGVEFFGCSSPLADVEVISMLDTYLRELGFSGTRTRINSIGNQASRKAYNAELRQRLAGVRDRLCPDCQRRSEVNPLRVLDCKIPSCQEVYKDFPSLGDFLDEESRAHFQLVLKTLEDLGVAYELKPSLVRGFDYYTHTVFEISLEGLGAQDAALGGGRYDGLVEELGGPATPAVGAAFGVERLIIALQAAGIAPPRPDQARAVYVLALEDSCLPAACTLTQQIRQAGLPATFDFSARGFKAGLRAANRDTINRMVVLGGSELEQGVALVKNLEARTEQQVPLTEVAAYLVG